MTCPCGSGDAYEQCCGQYIGTGVPTPTAEALMRSRYSAYVRGEIQHVLDSQDPSTREGLDPQSTEAWSKQSEWRGLEVVAVEGGGARDTTGTVEFIARYQIQEQPFEHHEVATFRKRGDTWYYLDGKIQGPKPFRREGRKIGPNEPCPCGSGKKYKKCCK